MGDLELSDHIETDNIQWKKNSKELVLDPNSLERVSSTSEEDDSDTDTTVSIGDVQDFKEQINTSVKHLSIRNSSGVVIGNQAYYHGDVTIQQYVLNRKDAVKILPGQSDVKCNLTYPEGGSFSIGDIQKEENTGLKSVLTSLKWRHFWYAVLVLLFVLGLSVALIILFPPQNMEGWDSEVSENTSLKLFSREEWGALKPRGEIKDLEENPPPYVIIAHTAGRNCSSFPDCCQAVRDTQIDHMGRGWFDMGMNFLVGGDGAAYTGLGWGKHGSHTIPFNRRSIAIYFMGFFMFDLPPKRQIRAAKLLIEEGVKLGKIKPDYKLFAQKQVSATESPGAALVEDLKKWPHWSTYESSDE